MTTSTVQQTQDELLLTYTKYPKTFLKNKVVYWPTLETAACSFDLPELTLLLNRFLVKQVLEAASLANPYMDTYYHKRDHSLLLALHNPVGPNGVSKSSWSTKLHSNVGFRNYLEHVVSSIGDWVREQVFASSTSRASSMISL